MIEGITGNRHGSNHASVTRFGGRFGRAALCCGHAAAGAGTGNRWIFRHLFERHGGGENQRTGALLRARRRPRRQAMTGTAFISGKQLRPAWSPPAEVKRDEPSLPNVIPGGSPGNPMGAAAMTLSGGGEYAIHGTNNPGSIGGFVSYGCIRMYNADVLDLYSRVGWGTTVVVTR